MSKNIIFAIKGTISKRDQARMMGNGVLVVEVDSFEKVKTLNQVADLNPNDVLSCAIEALGYGNDPTARTAFGKLIRERVGKNLTPQP